MFFLKNIINHFKNKMLKNVFDIFKFFRIKHFDLAM